MHGLRHDEFVYMSQDVKSEGEEEWEKLVLQMEAPTESGETTITVVQVLPTALAARRGLGRLSCSPRS